MNRITPGDYVSFIGTSTGFILGAAVGIMAAIDYECCMRCRQLNGDTTPIDVLAIDFVVVYAARGLLFGGGVSMAAAKAYGFFSGRNNPYWLGDQEDDVVDDNLMALAPTN